MLRDEYGDPVHIYIHECPFCHAIHENKNMGDLWCPDHQDKRDLYNRRNWTDRVAPGTFPWVCPGCDECREEKERLA